MNNESVKKKACRPLMFCRQLLQEINTHATLCNICANQMYLLFQPILFSEPP